MPMLSSSWGDDSRDGNCSYVSKEQYKFSDTENMIFRCSCRTFHLNRAASSSLVRRALVSRLLVAISWVSSGLKRWVVMTEKEWSVLIIKTSGVKIQMLSFPCRVRPTPSTQDRGQQSILVCQER